MNNDKMREALKRLANLCAENGLWPDTVNAARAALAEQPAQGEAAKLGRWSAVAKSDHPIKGVWVESDDFTHDVRLYVNGDFRDHQQRAAYAQCIADRLNAPPAPAVPEGWQPIETAPKDGLCVVVLDHVDQWADVAYWNGSRWTAERFRPLEYKPTYWLALPEPLK